MPDRGEPQPLTSIIREDSPELNDAVWQIRGLVRKPLTERRPVGYRSEFLDAYEPNRTFYLPERLREELGRIGQVGMENLPAGTHIRQVVDRLLIDLSWNSSRLEGNTYTLLETQRLLELGEDADGRATEEAQMILNHKAAIEMLIEDAGEIGFNRYTICNLHAVLADNLIRDGALGRVRSCPVGISGTVFHPLGVPQQIEQRFDDILMKADAIRNPLEQAFFVMVHLPYLQPFEDVNKRVSRLAANIPLIRSNLCPLSFVEVKREDYISATLGVYELNRVEYLCDVFAEAYRQSCLRYARVRQEVGEPDPFRMRHRAAIARVVREVVQAAMDQKQALKWIAVEAEKEMPEAERAQFIGEIEQGLLNLHEGNIARYRLRPAEFAGWQENWR
ncbi:Fic family protein [Luteolibacter flavescens]|uniref:Fic family protein n=1 Tax=Luteolibacter flavescens TaxID=1859460 RepID=A0ABT3FVC0_9BACT|nr:Fic family protein [Luteolibacter flavescens]